MLLVLVVAAGATSTPVAGSPMVVPRSRAPPMVEGAPLVGVEEGRGGSIIQASFSSHPPLVVLGSYREREREGGGGRKRGEREEKEGREKKGERERERERREREGGERKRGERWLLHSPKNTAKSLPQSLTAKQDPSSSADSPTSRGSPS